MIYFMRDQFSQVKIGYSGDPTDRLQNLQTGAPGLYLYAAIPGDQIEEEDLKRKFTLHRIDDRREFFRWDNIQEEILILDRMRNLSEKHMIIDPETADDWLRRYHYPMQRPITGDQVRKLAREMDLYRYEPTGDIFLAHLFDQTYLINGQHQLRAIITSGKRQVMCIREFRVYHPDRVRDLYWSYDRNKQRRFADVARCYEVEQRTGLTNTQVNKVGAACTLMHKQFLKLKGVTTQSDVDRVHMVLDYGQEALEYFSVIKHRDRVIEKQLERKYMVAIGIITLKEATSKYGRDKVIDFWRGVAENSGLLRGDVRKMVYEHLATTVINTSSTITKGRCTMDDLTGARVIAECWNAWTEGRDLYSVPIIHDPYKPIIIKGTHWKGSLPEFNEPTLSI